MIAELVDVKDVFPRKEEKRGEGRGEDIHGNKERKVTVEGQKW